MSNAERDTSHEDGQVVDTALPSGVALTAVAMAQERAVESARPDRLFHDPWARQLVRAAVKANGRGAGAALPWLDGETTLGDIAPGMAGYVPMRTRWIDDRLLAGLRTSAATQVVLLGAGLDIRPVRLPLPEGTTVFAIDHPAVLALASRTVADADGIRLPTVTVPADLAGDWVTALLEQEFDRTTATIWVAEGLLMYLPDSDAGRLLRTARASCGPGSRLLTDLAHPNILHNTLFAPGRRSLRDNHSPIRSSHANPTSWFAEHGWRSTVADPVALADRYRRPAPPALDPRPAGGPTFTLVEAWT